MIDDSKQFKIISHGYGAFSVSDCTLENAIKLLNENLANVGSHISDAAASLQDKTKYVVCTDGVVRSLRELMAAKVGQEIPLTARLLHGKPTPESPVPAVVFSNEHLTALLAWAQLNDIGWSDLNRLVEKASYDLESLHPKELFVLAGVYKRAGEREVVFIDKDVMETADDLAALQRGKWKDTAKLSNVVQRYLTFIQDHLTHRDAKFDIGRYDADA